MARKPEKPGAGGLIEPKVSRPEMPEGYGINKKSSQGLLPWSYVDRRMSEARNYWIGTARPDGRPHAMPVWGLWLDRKFYFGTDRNSRKGRNLQRNPSIVVHLESGDDVLILEGTATPVDDSAQIGAVDEAYLAKYGMRVVGHPGDPVIYSVTPRVVLAWREKDFPASATRWRFEAAAG